MEERSGERCTQTYKDKCKHTNELTCVKKRQEFHRGDNKAEVLDAETVQWFKNNGGLTRANGDHFRKTLLSRGGCDDAMVLFRDFRGQDASIEPLLARRGLN